MRVVLKSGEPWFVAKDVCEILGISNTADAINKSLDNDEKDIDKIYTPGGKRLDPEDLTWI